MSTLARNRTPWATILALATLLLSASFFGACQPDETCGPAPKSPLWVYIACSPDAVATQEELGDEPITISQQNADGSWVPCTPNFDRRPEDPPEDEQLRTQVCTSADNGISADCPGGEGAQAVRVEQGPRYGESEVIFYYKLSCINPPSVIVDLHELVPPTDDTEDDANDGDEANENGGSID